MSRHETRAALLDYAREWAAGTADNRQGAIQELLAACRPDRSPMWRWLMFTNLTRAENASNRDMYLDLLTGGRS